MVHILKSVSAGRAWQQAAKLIFLKGKKIYDGQKRLKEVLNVVVEVNNPVLIDSFIKKFGDQKMIEWMENNFLNTHPLPDWGYSYGQRLHSFLGIDQLQETVRKLQHNPDTKSATITFILPPGDQKHTPCVIALDLKIRNKKLMGTAFFRSQDGVKKFYADILALGKVMKKVATQLNIPTGTLILYIVSLHAYSEDFKKGKFLIAS